MEFVLEESATAGGVHLTVTETVVTGGSAASARACCVRRPGLGMGRASARPRRPPRRPSLAARRLLTVARPAGRPDPAPVFAALADPTRRAVLRAVADAGTATATELAAARTGEPPGGGEHLQALADAGLVAPRAARPGAALPGHPRTDRRRHGVDGRCGRGLGCPPGPAQRTPRGTGLTLATGVRPDCSRRWPVAWADAVGPRAALHRAADRRAVLHHSGRPRHRWARDPRPVDRREPARRVGHQMGGHRCAQPDRPSARREPDPRELVDGFLILVAGVLMVTPGFITDIFGFLLLIPPTRAVVRRLLLRRFRQGRYGRVFTVGAAGGSRFVGTFRAGSGGATCTTPAGVTPAGVPSSGDPDPPELRGCAPSSCGTRPRCCCFATAPTGSRSSCCGAT